MTKPYALHSVRAVRPLPAFALSLLLGSASLASAQGELTRLCEVKPVMKCLDKAVLGGATLKVPADAVAIRADGLSICDSSFHYTTAPDIVLIMDNTGSMGKVTVRDGVPRWCQSEAEALLNNDPGCISGDPDQQRDDALKTFVDSALVKGGKGINIGVVLFSNVAESPHAALQPLTPATAGAIKAAIAPREEGQTNYTAAFQAAIDLLKTSRKPKSEQFVIFVSDGRPNLPRPGDGGPYLYKETWDRLPVVHSIFLGANADNYRDMQEISAKTGGLFFNITDVGRLAGILTEDLAKSMFRRASPTFTTVSNLTTRTVLEIEAGRHVAAPDSSAWMLGLPGPLALARGVNDLVVKTEYGFGGTTQDVHFKVERTSEGPFPDLEQACRAPAELRVLGGANQPLNLLGLPILYADSDLRYTLTTAAPLDSAKVEIRAAGASTQKDEETARSGPSDKRDSTWSGSRPFEHAQASKRSGDGRVQVDHGETVTLTWRHPYIPEDSALARVRVKYGPEFDRAAYWDLDGDGRIETVRIRYLEELARVPERLQFTIADPSGTHVRDAKGGEIRFADPDGDGDGGKVGEDRQSLVVTLEDPFPRGVTSVQNADSSGRTFRQNDIPLMDDRFRVDDSVAPVIVKAEVLGPDRENSLTRVEVTYSEPVTLDDVVVQPLVFKRDTVVFDLIQMRINRSERKSERVWTFHLAADATFSPVGGDSVAINDNGETADLAGRTPARRVFVPVEGGVPAQGIDGFYVRFGNGSRSDATTRRVTPMGNGFIPVDAKGYAIQGSSGGKCGSCDPGREGDFGGPVIHIVTKQPVDWEFTVYTNLGQFVTRARGKVEEADLDLLEKIDTDGTRDPNDTRRVQRVVWTGVAQGGSIAGTGAYVLKAVFRYGRNFKTGAKAATNTRITRFGFLRACCESDGSEWYD